MKGRFLIFTGDGKGKTTAALGLVLRASGHGMRASVIQFVKSDEATGEVRACRALRGVEVVVGGLGFVPPATSPGFASHRERAEETLERAREAVADPRNDVVVLDEILTAVARGLLSEEAVMTLAEARRPDGCLVMTGRGATPALCEAADTVTAMTCVKHAYTAGRLAQKGVEF